MLYARIDLRARVADGQEFNYAVEQLARVTDEVYPEVKHFIATQQMQPSAGPGSKPSLKPPSLPVAETITADPRPDPSPGSGPGYGAGRDSDLNSDQFNLSRSQPPVDSRPVALNRPAPHYTEA